MYAIAAAEIRMLFRNRTVALSALVVPVAFAAVFIVLDAYGSTGALASVVVVTIMAMGTYVTATTTLAARRQALWLKRLRGGTVTDAGVLAGLVGPVAAVTLLQLAVVLTVLAVRDAPAQAGLVVVALLATEAMFVGLALATSAVTSSGEHAQYTTLPLFFAALGASVWFQLTGVDEWIWVKRVLPGGSTAELVQGAWDGGDLSAAPALVGISLAWAVVGAVAGLRAFRWEPRH